MERKTLAEVLEEVKTYLLEDPTLERGCMISKDGNMHPFENVSEHPRGLIQMGPDAFKTLCSLAVDDNLYAWVHSHPFCAPYPSTIDVGMHDLPCNMIIYGIQEDEFKIYSNEEIRQLKAGLQIRGA